MFDLNAYAFFLQQGKVLVVREKNRKLFNLPGGGLKKGETIKDGLIRELKEELNLDVMKANLIFAKVFLGPSDRKNRIKAYCYFIQEIQFIFSPTPNIEETVWINSKNASKYNLTWILKNKFLPFLIDETRQIN